MSKSLAITVVALSLCVSCVNRGVSDQEHHVQSLAEPARDVYALGTQLTAYGAVPADATGETFRRGGEVFLSINVAGASREQEIEVRWVGPDGKVLRREEASAPQGSRYAAFSSGETESWPEGEHRAVVIINGRKVSERPFGLM